MLNSFALKVTFSSPFDHPAHSLQHLFFSPALLPGILHKGDGTNIYLKEKPKTLVNILGNGERRKLNCDGCNGPAQDNRLLAPVALASGLDGSLYLGDYNFIRKLSPDREEIASILEMRCVFFCDKECWLVVVVGGWDVGFSLPGLVDGLIDLWKYQFYLFNVALE